MKNQDSEYRLYPFISDLLKDVGWDVRSPSKGGQLYTQNEVRQNEDLKSALGLERPEFVVDLKNNQYWVIEAKSNLGKLEEALEQAKQRAEKINEQENISCKMITGVVGSPDTTHYIKTQFLVGHTWETFVINKRESTGFVAPHQVTKVLSHGYAKLDEYEIDDKLFVDKITKINKVMHEGAIDQKGRAEVLACLLLALANDQSMALSFDPLRLIKDINTRAEIELKKHDKDSFFSQIQLNLPSSQDNHVKNKNALIQSIGILRDLNIASAIDSGRDVLGECYERFLKYANDAKEIGIVLTPRHITNFAAEVLDVKKNDIVFDPTCGTGGFLVAALDKVRRDNKGDIDNFKKGNLYGIEQDARIVTLAIVNMIFRGDGSSNIIEGDCLQKKITSKPRLVLMNPPFALQEAEWKFVDHALDSMESNGLLFAVLPTTTMNATNDDRGEITWRKQMLNRHTLISVIKLAEDLFYPVVSKGTYGVIIKAHKPHNIKEDKIIFAVLHDGIIRTKTEKLSKYTNTDMVAKSIKNYFSTKTVPQYIPKEIDCHVIEKFANGNLDLSPENYIGKIDEAGRPDVREVLRNIDAAKLKIQPSNENDKIKNWSIFSVNKFIELNFDRGNSGRKKYLPEGNLPLISTSQKNNGISAMVAENKVFAVYPPNTITVSANGGTCYACYHDYRFAANSDVYVINLRKEFQIREFGIFLCAAINNESWRYGYFRKLSQEQLSSLPVRIPVDLNQNIDFEKIKEIVKNSD